jgi:xanthine dehydrogenase large subunit
MFVIEAAIDKAAAALGVDASEIQKKNLIISGQEFPYGQIAESEADSCWKKAEELYHPEKLKKEVTEFNGRNKYYKKGIAFMPVCFGISFTKTRMNQARALVHVYNDGSVGISTAAVEMGQGVNTKILQVAANVFSIDPKRIRIHSTNTYRIANTSPTAASAAADLNGKATELACLEILKRLKKVAADELKVNETAVEITDEWVEVNGRRSKLKWEELAMAAFSARVS